MKIARRLTAGERKLAAIMYTDLVGYTALAQENEALSLAIVEEQRKIIRPLLKQHKGREIKTIGDAFLVVFSSALEAVTCAYEIQKMIANHNSMELREDRMIHLRIGIHLGDIVESDGDISGDAVNVASRIESLSEDGGICLTSQVYDQVQNKFEPEIESIGQKTLKNVSRPMEVYKVAMARELANLSHSNFDRKRVAVLPFENMSPDPGDEYFSNGMTEELITTISKISGLRVVSRTSVMGYRNSRKKLSEIARELNVGSIIEGSVRKSKNRVRITAQLIDAKSDDHLWSNSYDRELDDIFMIQSEVAENVADALRVKLEDSERKRITKEKTKNMLAYQNYLIGRQLRMERTPNAARDSIIYFESAIMADPSFAEAYAGLAIAYEALEHQGLLSSEEGNRRAREMVEKALTLDETLSEAHAVLGFLYLVNDWNLTAAKLEFQKAIELNPSDALSHKAYSRALAAEGKLTEATMHAEMSAQLDPVDPTTHNEMALMYYLDGRDEKAFNSWRRTQELFPQFDGVHFFQILIFLARVEIAKAEAEFSKLSTSYLEGPHGRFLKALILAATGRLQEALSIAGELHKLELAGHTTGDLVATVYAYAGDKDEFFRIGLDAVKHRHWELYVLKNYKKFFPNEITEDDRWKVLLGEAGLN